MRRISLAAGLLLALVCAATAQSKYDIAWTSGPTTGGGIIEYQAVIINRQTNKANICVALLDQNVGPNKITAHCYIGPDYRSSFPTGANIVSKAPQWPANIGPTIIWQIDTDTGAGEVCTTTDLTAPGQGCASFPLQ
jgi:hypothetical protein